METVADFIIIIVVVVVVVIWLQNTADGDCSHEIKRCLLIGRNVMINLDTIF